MTIQQATDELKALLTEAEFNSRWTIIEAHHKIGEIILQTEGEVTQVVQDLAVNLGRSKRMLWYGVKFYQAYPDLNRLPEGKNISMNKIITKYLTDGKEDEHEHHPITICSICKRRLDK